MFETCIRSSPRTWGCFSVVLGYSAPKPVFPTHVGVFLTGNGEVCGSDRLPHARGGVSPVLSAVSRQASSSPRTWGCFQVRALSGSFRGVFPTHVGVFPDVVVADSTGVGLPHARGGVSPYFPRRVMLFMSSPRTWGCFYWWMHRLHPLGVFPTHVGVFPLNGWQGGDPVRLPHARGGVSSRQGVSSVLPWSSPRTWGCFHLPYVLFVYSFVFPTHVGVFLYPHRPDLASLSLPHARGGVSKIFSYPINGISSSPRTWGCFYIQPLLLEGI